MSTLIKKQNQKKPHHVQHSRRRGRGGLRRTLSAECQRQRERKCPLPRSHGGRAGGRAAGSRCGQRTCSVSPPPAAAHPSRQPPAGGSLWATREPAKPRWLPGPRTPGGRSVPTRLASGRSPPAAGPTVGSAFFQSVNRRLRGKGYREGTGAQLSAPAPPAGSWARKSRL